MAFSRMRRAAGRRLGLGGVSAVVLSLLVAFVVAVGPVSAVAGWSAPTALGSVTGCSQVSAAIDGTGRRHVAAECATNVRYLTDVSGAWATTTFSHPAERFDIAPQIAIDGTTVYVAYTRAAPATCGLDYIGVYYRWRTLPNGAWSITTRLGRSGDQLQSFDVVDGVFHATVLDLAGVVQYETTAGGALKRYALPGATGLSSVAVGSDGGARMVYETSGFLRYAVFHGSGVEWSAIPGTGPNDRNPHLALDADNRAHVVWTHSGPPGCGAEEPTALDGTYYATNVTGEWTPAASRRFTRNMGIAELALSAESGAIHVLIGGELGIKSYTRPAGGSWSGVTVSSHQGIDVGLAIDAASGALFGAYSRLLPSFDLGGLYGLMKP